MGVKNNLVLMKVSTSTVLEKAYHPECLLLYSLPLKIKMFFFKADSKNHTIIPMYLYFCCANDNKYLEY